MLAGSQQHWLQPAHLITLTLNTASTILVIKSSRQTRLSKKLETMNSVAFPYEDKMCNNDFNVKGNLVRYTKTHGIKRSFLCDVCGNGFARSHHLLEHKRSHTGERPFKCEECGKAFNQKRNLIGHKKIHAGERPFKCEECDKTFVKKSNLKEHKRIHTGERPFKCDECNITFIYKSNLTDHKKTHTRERPFQCEECDKRFFYKRNLKVHKISHTGERPHKCEECGTRFSRADHLTAHKITHTNKRPFKCNLCLKRFTRAGSLRYHIKNHSGDRPLKCPECGKGFQRKTDLNKHAFTHSSSPSFKCDACDARFFHKSSLKRHVFTQCTQSKKQPYKANRKPRKTSSKRCTTDRNPVQPGPDYNNEKSLESSHCDASLTSTTSNQHMKSKTHTMNSETECTTPGDVSTITQLPSMSNQPSTSDIHINKSQNQEEYGEYSEHTETAALLNEFVDTYPITLDPESCEQHDDFLDGLLLDQEMSEATLPDKQNADTGYLITQLHPVADWPLTSDIHVNKSQHQEEYEEIAEVLDYDHLQTIPPPKPSLLVITMTFSVHTCEH